MFSPEFLKKAFHSYSSTDFPAVFFTRCESNWTKLKSISDSSGWIKLNQTIKYLQIWFLFDEPLLFWVLFLGRFFQAKAEQMRHFLLMQSNVRFCRFENWTCSFEMDCLPAAYYIIPLVNHKELTVAMHG